MKNITGIENHTLRPLLLLGYGDIAQRLAHLSLAKGKSVLGVRRTPATRAIENLELIAADVTKKQSLKTLFDNLAHDACDIVVTLTPGSYSEQGYRGSYLACIQAIVETLPAYSPDSRVVFVSSTSVYPENEGGWVDEHSDCDPTSPTAKILVETESTLAASSIKHCNLRFSGIYGPGRTRLIETTRSGKIAPPAPAKWTNRIHANDCAGVLDFLLSLPEDQLPSCVVGTDCLPVPKWDVQQFIANNLGLEIKTLTESAPEPTTGSGKKCSNRLLLELGYTFLYPDYRNGFGELLSG